MRCLQVIEPVVIEHIQNQNSNSLEESQSLLDDAAYIPIPGQLMQRRRSGESEIHPWSIDISDGSTRASAPGLRLLW